VAIVDEQHRFGVHQRATMRAKTEQPGVVPHVLVMTATPIPRSLAMTLFGDLDVSVIDGLPPGRAPVSTRVLGPGEREEAYAVVRARLEAGEQAYIVTPTIDTDDAQIAGVRSLMDELERGWLSGRRLATLHGRLTRATREHVMSRFRSGLIDALVTTTVIEVGVDVPGATVMVVENADRFGLAQLHQLRGRVGRGLKPGHCLLIGEATTPEASERLRALETTADGFALAERDLEIRGPGEFFGVRQAGIAPFRVADLARDAALLAMARRDAAAWIDASPMLERPEDALSRRRLLRAHGESLGLGDVG
jgi:ATP-dependent DNA helicase RecG